MQEVCGEKLTMYCSRTKVKIERGERERERTARCSGVKQKCKYKSEKVEDKEESGYTCVEEKKEEETTYG